MPAERAGAEQREFLPIAQWVQVDSAEQTYDASNVVPLAAARA
jgi:hypothetical protein